MGKGYGSQSMTDPLRRVVVRRPDGAFGAAKPEEWHYSSKPNLESAVREHDAFVGYLRGAGAEVLYFDAELNGKADAIFVHDPAIVTDEGAIVLRMGKALRRGEEEPLGRFLKSLDVPILGTLKGKAVAEGGDLLWLDHDTLAVGQGFRTNADGLSQLDEILRECDVDTIPVDLPYFGGPEACLHLMSLVSLVAPDLAVVYPRLLPAPLWERMRDMGFDIIEVPEAEFSTLGPNVLALAPRACLALEGNPVTAHRLSEAGCDVKTFKGYEISLKAEGGPTCLSRPILREA